MTNLEYLRKTKDYEGLLVEIQLRDEEIARLKIQIDECWQKRIQDRAELFGAG